MDKSEAVDRLFEIQTKMQDLLNEASDLVQKHGGDMVYARAEAYWIPTIETCLTDDHDWCGGCMCTMSQTIAEMNGESED